MNKIEPPEKSIPSRSADFSGLTPDAVLDALESVDLAPQAALLALNSYENRVYQFRDFDEKKFVVKFYRPLRWSAQQILEEHQFCFELVEAEIPVVAPLILNGESLFEYQGFKFAVFECRGGRGPNLDDKDTLVWLGRFIGRIHLMGETISYQFRPSITLQNFGVKSVDFLLQHRFIPSYLAESYRAVSEQLLNHCARHFNTYQDIQNIRLHGDCHPGNLMWTDQGPHFVDFDDSRMGPAVQDLWMLVNDSHEQWDHLLLGYEDFREFDERELKWVEPLRTLRMLHYSAWLAERWDDPSFPLNFPWFNTARYWEEHILSLKEQLAEIQD